MKKTVILTAVVAVAVLGAIFGIKAIQIRRAIAAHTNMVVPPVTISATQADEVTWPVTCKAVGTLASYRGVTLKTELEGAVRRVVAESGALVEQGAVLVELDDSVEAASLPGLEAQQKLAEINLNRARELRANGTNTESELDSAEAVVAQARSAVAQLKATLAKKCIVAPFPGQLGTVQVYPGQFMNKGDAVVQIESLDQIHADFSLPQQDLSRVAVGQTVRLTLDTFPGQVFEGKVTSINPHLNEATRSIDLRATLPNAGELLRPGMFTQVDVLLPTSETYVVLPTAAIVYNPYGNIVYVVENGVAKQRIVQTGPARGSQVAVLSGVKAGETVVTSGQIKLRNNSPVQIDNAVTPSANPAPKPQES